MKKRILSAIVIGVVLISIWLFLFFTPVYDIFFALLSAVACFEVTRAIGLKNKQIQAVAIIFSFILPLALTYPTRIPVGLLCILYVMFLIVMCVIHNQEVDFSHLTGTIYASFIIPVAFSMGNLIADLYKVYDFIDERECQFFIWFAVSTSLFTDVFSQLSGMAFGKHKMTPILSPKKTIEGAVGGISTVILLNCAWYFIYTKCFALKEFALPFGFYILLSPVISIAGIYGDLIASFIKRKCDIKDYSNLIPGHGGVMDRFDSVALVLPTMYVLITIYGLVVG
ncbi:MAG: CDP-archaeol synthase [Ruminococcaceae bacterium]|nr:CDP-archaeol synthase [Oscillospiraceae bacterium]